MKKAVAINPSYPQNLWYLGFAYINAGNDEEAVKAMNVAISMWYRGTINLENGRLVYDIDRLIKNRSNFAPKMEILGAVSPYIRLKMWPELLSLYLSILAENPSDVEIHKSLALVYQNLGLDDKVQEELKIVESLIPKQ